MHNDEDLYNLVKSWVDKLPRQLTCPACHDHHWELRSLEETLRGAAAAPGQVPPVVTLMCQCCGHLSFFDTKALQGSHAKLSV